jgi:tripartite-type tricarboxylate transporter receptor subunit TctC
VKQRVLDMGADIIVSTPQQFTAQIRQEVDKWGRVIRAAKIQVE